MGLFYLFLVLYLAAVAFLGWLGYKHTKSSKDYMVAGGNVHPFVMGMAYGATFISTSAIVGFGGVAGFFGMSMLWLTFANIFVGIFLAFVLFGRRTRALGQQLGVYTFPQLLGARFESVFIRRFAAVVLLFMPLYAAAVMIGGARFLQQSMQMNYSVALWIFSIVVVAYVFFGGLRGVVYTDAFQGSLMFVIMVILIILTYSKLGGISAAHAKLDAMRNLVPPPLAKQGMTGFASMPAALSPNWWLVMSTLVLGVGIGVLAQPQLVVRFMTVKSGKELNRALVYGGVFILFMTGVAFTVGALSNVWFYEHLKTIAMSVKEVAGNTDNVIPVFIKMAMPPWLTYALLLALLAAAMSTLSGQFHVVSTSIGYDLNPNSAKTESKRMLLITRISLLVAFVVTVWVAFQMPASIIAIATAMFFGLCAAAFLPMYVGALFWRRSSKAGATWSMVVGTVIYLFIVLFVHTKEAAIFGLSKTLFGVATIVTNSPFNYVDPLITALPASIVVFVIVSMFTKASDVYLKDFKNVTAK